MRYEAFSNREVAIASAVVGGCILLGAAYGLFITHLLALATGGGA